MRRLLIHRFRQDRVPMLLYLLTFVIMSYPFVFRMHDHLPMDNVDTHHALWQNWWAIESVTQGYDVNYSELLFYPNGLDLTLLPPRWASLPIWTPLYLLFGDPLAFNLTAMFGVLLKAYGMYLLGLYLFKRRIPAWVTGAFYAFAATSLQLALQQPLTGATEWLPWFMLAYIAGITQLNHTKSPKMIIVLMVLAGLFFSFNAYANLKIAIFATLLGGGFALFYMLGHQLWRIPLFYIAMIVFGVSAVGFSLPILIPVLQSTDLASANDGVILMGGIDILSFIKAEHNRPFNYMQLLASFRGEELEDLNIWGMSHVGFVSIAFALMGLLYAFRKNRTVLIWAILALVFWLLSLGIEIRYYRELVDIYWTPYRLLEDNFIFQTIKWPYRMSIPFLFAYAILIGYGLNYRLQSVTLNRKSWGLLTLAVIMLLYGTSIFPIPMRPAPRPDYLQELATLPDGAIINLPMGRHNAKYYMSVQRFHQRPMIEGMIARVPEGTYDYIDTHPILSPIRDNVNFSLDSLSSSGWQPAIQQLIDDGFRYIVLHRHVPQTATRIEYPHANVVKLLSSYSTVYEDEDVLIYDLNDLLLTLPEVLLE